MHNSPSNAEIATPKEIFSLVSRLSYQVPGAKSIEQAMAEIAAQFDLTGELQAEARLFLTKLVSKRRAHISRAWSLTCQRQILDELPAYDPSWQHGLTFISAPMGCGKSKHIAAPFISESMGRRYTVAMTPSKSLCKEQSEKFGIDLYSDLTKPDGYASSAMSVCLPSLDKPALQEHIGQASAFVMDEWSQSLKMLAKRGICNQEDFDRLSHICGTMDAGIFADAFLSDFDIQFVTRHAKPGTPVRIFEVQNKDQGFKARYTYGVSARDWIVQEVLAEMDQGGKAWVSCEGRRSSQTIGEILKADGYKVLIVNSLTSDLPEVKSFLANAEEECLQYDAVIHSPTITSGMSIAGEKHGQHFTRGFFLGGGWRLQPTVCAQMLRRVRYIREWSIGIAPNNGAQTVSDASEDRQVYEIEQMTGQAVAGREAFIRQIEHRDINQRADFASAMVWLLEDMRFNIERVPCTASASLTDAVSQKAAALDDAARAAILAAPILTEEQIEELKRSHAKTPEDHHALTAANIRGAFGVDTLTPEIVNFYDDGRGVARLRRFSNASGLELKDARPDRALNDDGAIQRELYRYLFDGIDILGTITKDIAETVLDRIMARRFTLATFGCVPTSFARITEKSANRRVAVREDRDGHICEFPRPKYAARVLADVLDMMGLKLQQAKQSGSNGSRSRDRSISEESLAMMQHISNAHIAPLSYTMISHVCADKVIEAASIETPTEPVSPNMFSVEAFHEELKTQRIHERLMPTAFALANEAFCLVRPFLEMPHTIHELGKIWLPMANENGMQVCLTVPVPDFLAETDEVFYPIEHGADMVFPFNIDLSAREVTMRRLMKSPLVARARQMKEPDYAVKAMLKALLAA